MIKKEFGYNFHDSVVVSCEMEKLDRLILVVILYEIFYPTKEYLKLTISGIFNFEKVSELVDELNKDSHKLNRNGTRIDSLNYNADKISKDLDLNLLLSLDGYKQMNIHCKKLRIERVGNTV
ncbi:hypothetical protein N9344_00350 [bacterium]|nr:hypothetical protein [bacterium]